MAKPLSRVKTNINLTSALLLWLGAIVLSAIFGLTLAFGIYPLTIGFFVLIAGAILVVKPLAGTWVVIIGALVFSGLIDLYLPGLQPIKWALAGLSMAVALIAYVFSSNSHKTGSNKLAPSGSLIFWLWTFFAYVILLSLFNWHGFAKFVTSFKGYFQVWGLLIALYYLMSKEADSKRIVKFILILGIVQLPFVFHQFFVLIPQRTSEELALRGVVAADVVAGTFGGSMTGGGRSSSLALLCALGITLALSHYREHIWKLKTVVLFLSIFMVPMFFSEAKLFIVLLPVALFLLYKDKLFEDPLKFIFGAIGVVVLLASIFFAYSLIPGADSQQHLSLQDMWDSNVSYNFGDRGYGNLLLNRTTVYAFWIEENFRLSEILHILFGYGAGETQGGVLLNEGSELLRKYPGYGISLTGISTILWELGLFGFFIIAMVFISAYKMGGKLLKDSQYPLSKPMINTARISVVLFVISMLHNSYFFFDLSYQSLFVLVFGYLLVMDKISRKSLLNKSKI
ncbi:hypothetical protein LG202_03320 [Methylobacillus methanolivorans]